MGKISTWIAAKTIIFFLSSGRTEELVDNMATDLDELVDKTFKKDSEKIQQRLVEHVFVPLSRKLMEENPMGFKSIIKKELEEE